MRISKTRIFIFLAAIALISSACYFPQIMTSDQAVATEVEKALDDIMEQTASAKIEATYTPYPTYTPAPTYTTQAFTAPYYDAYVPSDSGGRRNITNYCNNATFVSETIPDNTIFSRGDTFTKTWTLRNTGRCTWSTDYHLIFYSGNSLGGVIASELPHDVPPGGIVLLSVDLTAPSAAGTYKGDWSIESDDGYRFAKFWVQIKVR